MAQAPTHGMVLELNDRGQIIRSLQDPEGLVFSAVSEVEEENGILFIGSYNKKFVGTLDMKNLPPPVTPAPTPGPGSGERWMNATQCRFIFSCCCCCCCWWWWWCCCCCCCCCCCSASSSCLSFLSSSSYPPPWPSG